MIEKGADMMWITLIQDFLAFILSCIFSLKSLYGGVVYVNAAIPTAV